MAERMREVDWSRTAVGPVNGWPHSVRAIIRMMLTSRYAMWMGWGRELTFFYNDAYAHMTLGAKHPWALGKPASEVWEEIWPDIGPRIEHVLATGEATWDEGLLLFLERSGFPEETYHTFSYSPPRRRGVGGMFCVVTEETTRVIGGRQLEFSEFGTRLAGSQTMLDVAAVERRRRRPKDHRSATLYWGGVTAPWRPAATCCRADRQESSARRHDVAHPGVLDGTSTPIRRPRSDGSGRGPWQGRLARSCCPWRSRHRPSGRCLHRA